MSKIKFLVHRTISKFLPSILESEKLLSPKALGMKSPSWYDGTHVYLTPQTDAITIDESSGVFLYFDAEKVMENHPKFFINNGNSFGPLDGSGDPGHCDCRWTYNNISDITGPCVKHTLEEIENVLTYDMKKCDGGPEIGFPYQVDLLPSLHKIKISKKEFEQIKNKIPEKFLPYVQVMSTGGKKLKKTTTLRRRSYRRRRRVPFVNRKFI
jgi:hypothetical protein